MSKSQYEMERDRLIDNIIDPDLRQMLANNDSPYDHTGEIREAFVLLERRIRQSAGLADHDFGKDLIDKAFLPDKGILQPVSPVAAERSGLHQLLVGIFLYYRNPIAYRPIYFTLESSRRILSLIDHALELVGQSVELALKLGEYVGAHEGEILRRRDFRLDIDGDGEQEIIALLELGAVTDGNKIAPHLVPVILKRVEQGYRRISADRIQGTSMFGPGSVESRNVTGSSRLDLIVSWTWGMSQDILLILRWQNERYELVKRELAPGLAEPYSGPFEKIFSVHARQLLDFADVDGDGAVEIVQTLSFDPLELENMGYSETGQDGDYRLVVCRLLKWDTEKERIVLMDQRLVARR